MLRGAGLHRVVMFMLSLTGTLLTHRKLDGVINFPRFGWHAVVSWMENYDSLVRIGSQTLE